MIFFDTVVIDGRIGTIVDEFAGSTLAASVEVLLRRDILTGVFAPGEKLRIDAVCARYGVGSSPVREALSRLSSDGLVDRRDQRGFYAGRANLDDLRELVTTRCDVEALALRATIARRSTRWEERVVLALHHLSRSPTRSDGSRPPEWEGLHDAFHDCLIEQGGMRLRRFCVSLRLQANRYRLLSLSADPARPHLDEHQAIAQAAIDGKADDAADLLVAHYSRTLQVIEQSDWFGQ